MDFFVEILNQLSDWTWKQLPHIVGAMTASILMLYGDNVVRLVKQNTRKFHFLVRVGIFVAVCSIGFVLLDKVLFVALDSVIRAFTSRTLLFPVIFLGFVVIGIIAEKKRQM